MILCLNKFIQKFFMDIFTNRIFKNKVFIKNKLLKFGFKCKGDKFIYETEIIDGQFILIVKVIGAKNIETLLIDSSTKELYTLHLVDEAEGTFIGSVRGEYENVLNLIADKCCNNTYFISEQANRLADIIRKKYNNTPEFLWEKFPGFGVFRNSQSGKWYGLISQIDYSKLDKKRKGLIEILNIKLLNNEVTELQKAEGFYPAYHMNKKSWITIRLDETISDVEIMELIDKSYVLSSLKKSKNKCP